MVEYLEPRTLLSSPAVNPTTSPVDFGVIDLNDSTGDWQAARFDGTTFVQETLTSWENTVADKVVVHGDLWGTGSQDLVEFDPATGSFNAR